MDKKQTFNWQDIKNTNLGIEFSVNVLVGLVVGYLLDSRFHSRPWLTIVGLLVGIAAGALTTWKALEDLDKAEEKK